MDHFLLHGFPADEHYLTYNWCNLGMSNAFLFG